MRRALHRSPSGGGSVSAGDHIHASALVIGEKGVLVRGPSGAGKSRLVAALLHAGRAEGRFTGLVGDDRIALASRGGRLVAAGHGGVAGLIERRGLGLCASGTLSPAVVSHVVDLVGETARLPDPAETRVRLEGVELPRLRVLSELSGGDQAALVLFWLFG